MDIERIRNAKVGNVVRAAHLGSALNRRASLAYIEFKPGLYRVQARQTLLGASPMTSYILSALAIAIVYYKKSFTSTIHICIRISFFLLEDDFLNFNSFYTFRDFNYNFIINEFFKTCFYFLFFIRRLFVNLRLSTTDCVFISTY